MIFSFAFPERLRAFRECVFTGWVVAENGIYSAAFCESAALWSACSPSPSRLAPRRTPPFVAARHLPPERGKFFLKGGVLGKTRNVTVLPRPLTLGEVDASKASRRRGRGRYPNIHKIRQTPPSGRAPAAFLRILNKKVLSGNFVVSSSFPPERSSPWCRGSCPTASRSWCRTASG